MLSSGMCLVSAVTCTVCAECGPKHLAEGTILSAILLCCNCAPHVERLFVLLQHRDKWPHPVQSRLASSLPSLSVLCRCVVHSLFLGTGDRHGQDFSWLEASDQHPTFFRKSGRHTAHINSQINSQNCITVSVQHAASGLATIMTPASYSYSCSSKLPIISGADTAASVQIGAYV